MTGWLNPPHDRVTLTANEREILDGLERALAAESVASPPESHPSAGGACERALHPERSTLPSAGFRFRALAPCLRLVRPAPWLLPIGAVLMCLGLSSSILVTLLGVTVTAIGVVACTARAWARHPIAFLRGRHRGGG